MYTDSITVRGPWWSATSNGKYAFGLAIVTFCPDNELQVYAFTEVNEDNPFTIEAAEDLQACFETLLGKVIVEGHS